MMHFFLKGSLIETSKGYIYLIKPGGMRTYDAFFSF